MSNDDLKAKLRVMLIETIPDVILLQLHHALPHTRNMTLEEAHEMQRTIMDEVMEVVDQAFQQNKAINIG